MSCHASGIGTGGPVVSGTQTNAKSQEKKHAIHLICRPGVLSLCVSLSLSLPPPFPLSIPLTSPPSLHLPSGLSASLPRGESASTHLGLRAKFLARSSTCRVLEAFHLGCLSQMIFSGFTCRPAKAPAPAPAQAHAVHPRALTPASNTGTDSRNGTERNSDHGSGTCGRQQRAAT